MPVFTLHYTVCIIVSISVVELISFFLFSRSYKVEVKNYKALSAFVWLYFKPFMMENELSPSNLNTFKSFISISIIIILHEKRVYRHSFSGKL